MLKKPTTKTVSISTENHRRLKILAAKRGVKIADLVDEMLAGRMIASPRRRAKESSGR